MDDVIVLIGAGSIGQAIVRRIGSGKRILLGDVSEANAAAAAAVLASAGFDVTTATVDVASRASVAEFAAFAGTFGRLVNIIHAAGVSPSQAPIETILKVDLYGTALVLELFGGIIARGGSGLVISSQSGHRLGPLPAEQNEALAITPTEALLDLPFLQAEAIESTLHAYQLSNRGNGLRVMAQAVRWGERGARINSISPGIVMTPLANDELNGPRGDFYRRMIASSVAGRAGTPDEVGNLAHLLLGPDGAFITGADFLIDGGTTARHWYGQA